MALTNPTPDSILHTVFGYDHFKPLQREVIDNVLNRRDSLVIMPTGGGKSLCYQIPALVFPGLTVVVSPLIALMKDQVEQLQAFGVAARFLNSSLAYEEYQSNAAEVRSGKVKLLYVAPETLLMERTLSLLAAARLDCLAIDEAHCISEWGHDFRPEYRQLLAIRERFPQAVCLALTATATPRVREDIKASLRFDESNEFISSFNRENLYIEVAPKKDAFGQTLRFLKEHADESGIIYCFARKTVDDLAAALRQKGYSVRPYHAGLDDDIRRRNQDAFIRDDVQIVVATIAFGMGINKPNVRFVIHYDLPKSIEGYYQEIGRAGRDGLPAHCLLLYNYGDVHKLRYFLNEKSPVERQAAYQHLAALTRYAEGDVCRRVPLMAYFGETYTTENCGMCDNCRRGEQAQVDITVPAQKFLSCVARTGEAFGANHVVDVLLGSQNEKVLKYGHQNLSTHGIGKELKRDQWHNIGRQLVQKGFLNVEGEFSVLKLTSRAYEALKNREPIFGLIQEELAGRKAVEAVGADAELLQFDKVLFDLLKTKRKELADAGQVPPYVIFPDRTLLEMAAYYPQSPDALGKIHGVGKVKLERFGDEFLGVILPYCAENGLAEKTKPAEENTPRSAPKERIGKARYEEVAEQFNAGKTIPALAAQYDVRVVTILDHLTQYALEGKPLRANGDFLAMSKLVNAGQQAVFTAFADLGCERLKPVYDQMNGAVTYEELKILRLAFLCQQKER